MRRRLPGGFGQGDVNLSPSPLGPAARSRHVDKHPAHDLRRRPEKVGAVLPLDILPVDQPHERLVDQRGRLQDVAGPLASHLPCRQAVQFLVNHRRQRVERRVVTAGPRDEQLRNVWRGSHPQDRRLA